MNCNPGCRKDVQRSNQCVPGVVNAWPVPYLAAICFVLDSNGYLHAITR